MCEITLIATCHKDRGKCNPEELYKILEKVNPDIIFEELSPAFFTETYEGRLPDSLETKTIKMYLHRHPVIQIPVDFDGNRLVDKRLKNEINEMFTMFNHSFDYQELNSQLYNLSEEQGFQYLNSEKCKEILERKHRLEKILLPLINNEKTFETYKHWLIINDIRENEMIKNIYSYNDLNKYNKGLFLVGVEHRKPIMDKISEFEKNINRELNWNFNYFN